MKLFSMVNHKCWRPAALALVTMTLQWVCVDAVGATAFAQTAASSAVKQVGIQLENSSEGGQNIAFIDNTDFIGFRQVEFATGATSVELRVASNNSGGKIEIRTGTGTGPLAGTCTVPNTGGWQKWITVSCPVTGLTGPRNLYLRFTGGSGNLFNLLWFKFTAPAAISALNQIEAESFTSQVGTQTEGSSESGQNIGFIDNGDYLFFQHVDFKTGITSFSARVASNGPGGNIEVRTDSLSGALAGTCAVPTTGGWQTWTTVNCSVKGLTGFHSLYIKFVGGAGNLMNLNWFKFATQVIPPTSSSKPSSSSISSISVSSTPNSSTPTSSKASSILSSARSSVVVSSVVSSSLPASSIPASSSSSSVATVAALTLPIEVVGAGDPDFPTVVSTAVNLDGAASATKLTLRCHRCGFYNSPEFERLSKPLTKVAGSVRILGSTTSPNSVPWIEINDANFLLNENERAHGGINGGLLTIGMSMTLDASTRARLAEGANRIEFRLNGTDGNSNGYRILDVQIQNANGKDLITNKRQWADIAAEKVAGRTWTNDAAVGQTLWNGKNLLLKSPIVQTKMRAACSTCHASDGRDLQYFNYSNNSIVQRSKFHGLSDTQGKQIAAYLRAALYDKVPHVAAATPWNPPYQPGAGLDSKPVVEWAAGAGIDAVLPDAKSFVNVFTGKPANSNAQVTQADLDAAMDPGRDKVLNTREMPLPLQFPDWNAWLPIQAPIDVWTPEPGQTEGLFETKGDDGSNPIKTHQRVTEWLKANKNPNGQYGDWSHLTAEQRERVQYWLDDFGKSVLGFVGGGRGSRVSGDPANPYGGELGGKKLQTLLSPETASESAIAYPWSKGGFTKEAFIERSTFSIIHWMGVKQWELAHTYGLEGQQSWLHGKRNGNQWIGEGEKRGWTFSWPSVFYMAPHMLFAPQGGRENYFSWEPRLVSFYRTNQWYQLQVTVNPGWAGASSGPMDWPYHMGFTTAVVDDLINAKAPAQVSATHLARFFQVRTKLAQLANTDIPFNQPDPQEPLNLFKNLGHNSRASLAAHKLGVGEVVDRGPEQWEQSRFRLLDSVTPGLHLLFINSSISLYNKLYSETTYEQWRRCDPNALFGSEWETKTGFRFCLDKERKPLPLNNNGQQHLVGGWVDWTTEQYTVWSVISARQHGAEPQRLKVFSDWVDRMWPQ